MPISRLRFFLALGFGIIAVSFASIIIRITPAPSLLIATGRMVFASLLLAPFFCKNLPARRNEFVVINWWLVLLAGLFLAGHFALWIESLKHTTVVSSVVLVAMNPLFVTLAAPFLLKEPLNWQTGGAVLLGFSGVLLIAGPTLKSTPLTTGNILALGGALCAAGYVIIGRKLRPRLSLINYVYPVYTTTAIILLLTTILNRIPITGYQPKVYLLIFLLALGPQVLGHTTFNWALKFLPAPVVAMSILGEPVGTTVLSWLLLHQPPTRAEIAGGLLIAAGIYLSTRSAFRLNVARPGTAQSGS